MVGKSAGENAGTNYNTYLGYYAGYGWGINDYNTSIGGVNIKTWGAGD